MREERCKKIVFLGRKMRFKYESVIEKEMVISEQDPNFVKIFKIRFKNYATDVKNINSTANNNF